MHAGGPPPGVLAGRRRGSGGDGVELLVRPVELALPGQLLLQRVAQVGQELHVERRVPQPRFGERAGRPVDGGVALLQGVAEDVLHHRAETHPGEAREPPGQLGVEEALGDHAYVAQAREILGGGVQQPLGVLDDLAEAGEVGAGHRVDQGRTGALTAQLHEVRALPVAVARGPLGVDRQRTAAGRVPRHRLREGRLGGDHLGHSLARGQQRDRSREGGRWAVRVGRARRLGRGERRRVGCGLLGVGHRSRVSVYTPRPPTERSLGGRVRTTRVSG